MGGGRGDFRLRDGACAGITAGCPGGKDDGGNLPKRPGGNGGANAGPVPDAGKDHDHGRCGAGSAAAGADEPACRGCAQADVCI